jgi:hypothetical protein
MRRLIIILTAAACVALGLGLPASASTNDTYPANVDYAAGGYGAYNSKVLSEPWVQGVDINIDWSTVQPKESLKSINWGPLNKTALKWAKAGKHIIIVVRFANETNGVKGATCQKPYTGQILPGWEATRVPTFCDKDMNTLIPDYFNPTFQSDWLAFVDALGSHLANASYKSSISYVRLGVGLGGESFLLMPNGTGGQKDEAADKRAITAAWHYTPQKWQNWQKAMLTAYRAAIPARIPVIYAIAVQDTYEGHPIDYNVALWAMQHGGFGIGQECLGPTGFGSGDGYADFNNIDNDLITKYPATYLQFQGCGQVTRASEERSIISLAEKYHARSYEWYESTLVPPGPPSSSDMTAYQTWVNHEFR